MFSFELPRFKVAEADYKVTLRCIGEQPSGFENNWTLPDEWKFKRLIHNWRERICPNIVYALAVVFLIATLWWGRGVMRATTIPWKAAMIAATALTIAWIARILNEMPT